MRNSHLFFTFQTQLLHEDDAPICFAGVAQRAIESCVALVEPIIRVGGGADKARALSAGTFD